MKALIFNSGIGKRMLELTVHCPKSMVHLYNDETIFERQIRLLQEAGIKKVIITTGPYSEAFKDICNKPRYSDMYFEFPHNEIYDTSNYIYSMYKAKDLLDDDVLMMHGDLVFDRSLIPAMLKDSRKDLCLINKYKPLPEKDFKGRIVDGYLREVGIDIFDDNCFAFQPLYKLSKETIKAWIKNVVKFVNKGNINVYAENALNEISSRLFIYPKSYSNHFIEEIDNKDDLKRVNSFIEQWDFKKQNIKQTYEYLVSLKATLKRINSKKPFIVADSFLEKEVSHKLPNAVVFSNFTPNPKYAEMLEGLKLFKKSGCDSIISIGGGSCIDVAKTIKLSLNADVDSDIPTFEQQYKYTDVQHICLPTTSGTGSESTRHAVLYLDDIKQSISNSAILPEYVILSSKMIYTVPEYQKKCTAMDALCQCIESLWSKKATKESIRNAIKGIRLFKDNFRAYLDLSKDAIKCIQLAANYSGKAINISETTAAHAMSYKITSLFRIPHGHAVAICMNAILNTCHVRTVFRDLDIKNIFNDAIEFFRIRKNISIKDEELKELVNSVNHKRLENFPFRINLKKTYCAIKR